MSATSRRRARRAGAWGWRGSGGLRRARGSRRLCSVGLWRIFGRRVIDYTLYFFCSLPVLSGPALRLCWKFISVYTIRIPSSILLHHISSMPLIVTSKKSLSRRLQVFPLTIDQSRIAHTHTARAQAAVRGTGRVDPLRTSRTRSKTRLQSTRGGDCVGPCVFPS
jgi:hypothetical protein